MAYRVIWSSRAVEDVDAIAAYIARDSPSYAAAVVHKVLDTTRVLEQSPLAGAIIAEYNDASIREQSAYTYRIIYQVWEKTVTVASVIHSKSLFSPP